MSAMHASPPVRPHALPMKQSVLNFQPRHSTSHATTSSDSIVVDDSDSGIETPPPPSKQAKQAKPAPPYVDDDEVDDIDFTTPPRPKPSAPANGPQSSSDHIVIDDDDEELSDPPSIKANSPPAAKKLVKKRPSTSGANAGPAVKKVKSSTEKKADSSTFGSDAQRPGGEKKKIAPPGEGVLCHQHRAACATEQVRCTIMRPNGKRCSLRYCDRGLKTLYGMDIETIKKSGRTSSSTDAADTHCGPEEASYCFKCPRCRGICECSLCRKKLEPSSTAPVKAAPTAKKDSVISTAAKKLPPTGKTGTTAKKEKKDKASSSKTAEKGVSKPAKASIAAMVASPSRPNGISGLARQTSLPRPLKAPAAVPAPELEIISTRLPADNIWARVWIYETLVRFDFIKVPKTVLSQLDKFDAWTHRHLQTLLERIIVALAALPNINSGQPKARTKEVVTTYRQHGSDWSRGEPWMAARKLCENNDAYIPSLPAVDDSADEEPHGTEEDRTPVDTGPTLLGSRNTRTRRAAELKALERVKAQSYAEYASSEEADRDSEAEEAPRRKSSRYQASEQDDDEDGDSEEDDAPRGAGTRSRRQPADRTQRDSPEEVRRSGRQRQAVQHYGSAPTTGTARTRGSRVVSSATDSASAGGSATPQERASPSSSAEPSPPPAERVPAPAREEKVAIICALLDAIMQTPEVAEELRVAPQRLIEIEKTAKEDLKEIEKEWEKESADIWKAAPSMLDADKFVKWKKDKEKKEREYKLRILDTKTGAYRESESLKMRSGPLGTDADGRVFWQLTEFNENMPVNTAGRWSWCVVIYGEPMTRHAPAPESMPKDVANISPLKPKAPREGEEDGKSQSFLEECQLLSREPGDGPPSTPRKGETSDKGKARATSSPLTPPPGAGSDDNAQRGPSGKAFMGTNYPPTISEMISFIKYRAARLDYEELQAQQEQDRRAALAAEGSGSGGDKSVAPVSRKAKRLLKEAQDARRKQVEDLAERLRACRRYYLWQFAETDEGEPNVNA